MTTGYEVEMYRNIGVISQSLMTIARCMEAAEARARRKEEEEGAVLEGVCAFAEAGCIDAPIVMLNGEKFCQKHMDEGFAMLRRSVDAIVAGFEEIEASVRKEGNDQEVERP